MLPAYSCRVFSIPGILIVNPDSSSESTFQRIEFRDSQKLSSPWLKFYYRYKIAK